MRHSESVRLATGGRPDQKRIDRCSGDQGGERRREYLAKAAAAGSPNAIFDCGRQKQPVARSGQRNVQQALGFFAVSD
jgi:hypothetical protein